MTTTRQQLTIASFRELWKNEFLPEIRKEIDSANASLYTEIRDLNKRLDEFEKTLSFFSEQYDQLIKITQTTKKQMQQIESKIEDQGKTITGLKNNDYDNMAAIDEIQQYQRRDCLEITATLGVLLNENDISTAHRLPPTRKIQDRIIVKFVRRDIREEIYKKRKVLNGKLTDCLPSVNAEIGKSISQPTKIFINESLTAYRKRLFGKIHDYRRQHNYKFIWTANGKILLRQTESSPVNSFTTEEEFQRFISKD
ncbi:Hypothetical predicted protein [Paramuricea clavata]|uniref:FP protein C-terminal domain-containing protein n=1 Tax=Paramuricea clavata TaxID=317549 RepID=A0A6S7L9A4_PARCT|nr:Hypothetical predicted protein [Paramuricea clavata]